MKPINFNEAFSRHLKSFNEAHLTGTETDEEKEELQLKEYEKWLDTPQDWLQGETPNTWFAKIDDPNALVKLLASYVMAGIAVPEPMDNRLIEMKESVYPLFLYILQHFNEGEESAIARLKVKIISLLSEMEKPHPYPLYIAWISQSSDRNDLAEEAAAILGETGAEYKEAIIKACRNAEHEYAADCFIDILSNFPGEPYIVEMIIDEFEHTTAKKAFYANCLGKLMDPDALNCLYEALEDRSLNFYDYTAVKYAIEELGGTVTSERDFTGDEDFDRLMKL